MTDAQTVCDILESIVDVTFEPHDLLRARIPNSMMLMQAVLGLEARLSATIDLSRLDYDATVGDLVGIIEKRAESDQAADPDHEISLSPIQIAYLLGSEEDIELGGQSTFIYAEAAFETSAHEVAAAVRTIAQRHDVFSYRPDLETGTLKRTDSSISIETQEDDSPSARSRVREELMEQARKSNEDGPLVGVRILGNENASLCAYFNMVIMDAGSLYVFFRELRDILTGKDLPEAMPLRQATRLTTEHLQASVRQRDLEYWRTKVQDFPTPTCPAHRVMGDHPWHTERLNNRLDADLSRKLERVAEKAGASLSALILAACSAVVSRWNNSPGLMCNVTVSRRTALDPGKSVMGDFTSSMLMGIDVDNPDTIGELASTISRDMHDGIVHGSVSGVEVMTEFLRTEENQEQATASIVFTSYLGGSSNSDLKIDYLYTQTAQVSLDMQAMPAGNGQINLSWDVVPEYFPYATDMFECLKSLLARIADGHDALPVVDQATVIESEKCNSVRAGDSVRTMLDLVRDSVRKYPTHQAIIADPGYTYQELWEASGNVAAYLREKGAREKSTVIIEFAKDSADVVAMVAALRLGAAYVPVAAHLPAYRRDAIRRLIPGSVTITTDEALRESRVKREFVSDASPSREDLAYIIFTSGSTGVPKGVEISHGGAVGTISDINDRYGVDSHSRIIGLSSLGFDLSVYDIFGSLAAGATLVMVHDERDADRIIDVLRTQDITVWNSAPALMELALLRCEQTDRFDSVRTIMLSGDRIPASMPARAHAVFPNAQIYSLGGATEASIWSIQFPLDEDSLDNRIPYGYPLAGQGIHILGYDLTMCPRGVPGDIWISGQGVALGYARQPELTAEAFRDIPGLGRCYRTGDIGLFNHEGFVEFLGRKDRQVKVSGHRIELGEIESVLSRSGLVITSCAAIMEGAHTPSLVCAYVPRDGVQGTQIRDELAQQLPDYMIPRALIPVDSIPMTVNGKLDQKALKALFEGTINDNSPSCDSGESVAGTPSDSSQLNMQELFEEVLHTRVEDPSASFFALGGDSLRFQMLLKLIGERTGRRLRFRDLIRNPCVLQAAQLVESAQASEQSHNAMTAIEHDPYAPFPLTEMQMAYYVGRQQGFDLGGVGEHFYIESVTHADMQRLENALNAVIQRHEMLRAVFTDDGRQRVLPEVPRYTVDVKDLRCASDSEISEATMREREALSHECFDLGTWPLFRLQAHALPDGTHRLFFSIDMIIGDGASQRIFIKDLARAYRGEELPPVAGSYRDHVIAIKRIQDQNRANAYSSEIKRMMEEFPLGNVLPANTSVVARPHMRRMSWDVFEDLVEKIRSYAAQQGVSLSTVLLYAYASSLALSSREGKIGINVTTYNRNYDLPGIEEMFGDFTGIALIDFDESEGQDALPRIQQLLLEQIDDSRSGVQMLAEMGRLQGFAGQALAPFVFTSLLFDAKKAENSVLGHIEYAISQTPQVLIDHQVLPTARGLNISWDFVEQILDPALMEQIFAYFKSSLRQYAESGSLSSTVPVEVLRTIRHSWASTRGADIDTRTPTVQASNDSTELSGSIQQIRRWLHEDYALDSQTDLDESLFNVGIDSLGFVQLVQKVQRYAGGKIPLAQALASPTIRTLAQLSTRVVQQDERSSSLSLLRQGDQELVIVMVHGGFGTVDIYRDLALGMKAGPQIWGLKFDYFARQWPQHISVEEIAQHYRAEIDRQFAPSTRFVVVGWSAGGTLGHALASLLASRCEGLVLLDSLAPGAHAPVGEFTLQADETVLKRAGVVYEKKAAGLLELWSSVENDPQAVCKIAQTFSDSLLEDLGVCAGQVRVRDLSTLRTLIAARNEYAPSYCAIPTLIVVPDDGEAYNYADWAKFADCRQTEKVVGNHYSFVIGPTSAPTVQAVEEFITHTCTRQSVKEAGQA